MSEGYGGDEPRRGGVRGGYGQEPGYRGADPREGDQPGEDGAPRVAAPAISATCGASPTPGRPMPGAAWTHGRNRAHGRRTGPFTRRAARIRTGGKQIPIRATRTLSRPGPTPGTVNGTTISPMTGPVTAARQRRPGGGPRPGAGSRRNDPGPAQSYQSPVVWDGPDRSPSRERREPDAPTGPHRNPDGWYAQDDRSRKHSKIK